MNRTIECPKCKGDASACPICDEGKIVVDESCTLCERDFSTGNIVFVSNMRIDPEVEKIFNKFYCERCYNRHKANMLESGIDIGPKYVRFIF